MIDSHCHFDRLAAKGDPEHFLARARSVGITHIVSCACSLAEEPVASSPMILPQIGLHPWWAAEAADHPNWLERIRERLIANPTFGVGEIGLDKNRAKKIPMTIQTNVFVPLLQLGLELERTCTVHCVSAFGPLIVHLKNVSLPDTVGILVMHSYSGSAETMRELIRLKSWFVFFSVSGHCPKESVIREIPNDRLLIETDSPDQQVSRDCADSCPLPLEFNDCSQLLRVANRVAVATERPLAAIVAATRANAIRAFRIVV